MTSNVQAIAQMFGPLANAQMNLPAFAEIYPDAEAPVLIARAQNRRLGLMRWGWPPFGEIKRSITNIRNLASPMWRSALEDPSRRCLVPVTQFSEWSATPDPVTGRKRKHWFALNDQPLFAFAGLWRSTAEGPRFAFLTCAPNAIVGRVHPKAMPVILASAEAAHHWLTAEGDAAAQMQRPFADDAMHEIIDDDTPSPAPAPPPPAQPSLF